jgi:glyoxylase-like metal-dependent hydrolase (beta-lactamase superfamily II)/rhodanese-related sulfurtransferase
MKIEQLYTGCLAEAAYYIESEGEVAIIDPLRESAPYIAKANANHAKIKYVLETHFHADFVSGHLELAQKTNSTIVFGPTAQPSYPAHIAADGDVLPLGKIKIKVLHTPGHTLESTCYLAVDEKDQPHAVFTGDTLFIGDVGRPDLVQKVKADITPHYLGGLLFDSLRHKLMTLPDEVMVYPGHGAGSACGKKMDKETVSTIGLQKKYNYALRADMSKEEFISAVTDGLVEPPQYFPANVILNLTGNVPSIDEVLTKANRGWKPEEFDLLAKQKNALVLDTRKKDDFVASHLPHSIFIGIDDSFAPWVGTLINDLTTPILLVTAPGREEEVITRLSRVGYDNAIGYLKGGLDAWQKSGLPVASVKEITAAEFALIYKPTMHLLDARRKSEFDTEHLEGAENFPLDFVNRNIPELDKNTEYFIHCAGGYRSVILCSILQAHGFTKLVNIKGGYNALAETSLKRSERQVVQTEL